MTSRVSHLLVPAVLVGALTLTACGGDSEDSVPTTQPEAAESTQPSSVVNPSTTEKPWTESTAASTTARPGEAEVSAAPGATVAPEDQTGAGEGCDVPTISRDVGEEATADQMILGYCDGRWANVALQAAGLHSWAVREDGPWSWLTADGYVNSGAGEGCYLRESLEAHAPVPQAVYDDISLCGPEDTLFEDSTAAR